MPTLQKKARKVRDRVNLRVKDFEVYVVQRFGENLEVKHGKRDVFEVKDSMGYALRLHQKGALSFAYGSDFGNAAIDAAIEQGLNALPFLKEHDGFSFTSPQKMPAGAWADSEFAQIPYVQKFAFVCALENCASSLKDKAIEVVHASLEDECERVILLNHLGLELEDERTSYSASIAVQAKDGEDEESAHDTIAKTRFKDLEVKTISTTAVDDALMRLGGGPMEGYRGPVLLRANVVCDILEAIAGSFFGEEIMKGTSTLKDKGQQKIYSEKLTIVDDGLLADGVGSSRFDDEGMAKQTTVLVENGVVKNFLYDRFWGQICGVASTANAHRANLSMRPQLAVNNFYIKPGEMVFPQLLEKMHTGVVITDCIGMHTADTVSGNFSVGVVGYHVDGKTTKPISHMVLTDNMHRLLAAVQAKGGDLRFYGHFGAPSLLIAEASLSGK